MNAITIALFIKKLKIEKLEKDEIFLISHDNIFFYKTKSMKRDAKNLALDKLIFYFFVFVFIFYIYLAKKINLLYNYLD